MPAGDSGLGTGRGPRRSAAEETGPGGLLHGSSAAMRRLYRQIERVAATDATILVIGESGTGKEVTAQTIHRASARGGGPFVPVNCGAIAPSLIEAELFGHEKGSFTGAMQQRAGYFEYADKGTIFLDEITEMPPSTQVKLLRVLESSSFYRVGGSDPVRIDVRVIAATNRDPETAVRQGQLRRDLMYRLAVFPLLVPPLRERREDIELLARHFVERFNQRENASKTLSRRSIEVLRAHPWPGNVRELHNTLYRAYILADRTIDISSVSLPRASRPPALRDGCLNLGVGTPLAEAQRELILATLQHFAGNKPRTARALGISLKTLYNRLSLYGDAANPSSTAEGGTD